MHLLIFSVFCVLYVVGLRGGIISCRGCIIGCRGGISFDDVYMFVSNVDYPWESLGPLYDSLLCLKEEPIMPPKIITK